jgi:SAM-dependent methyltransferase
MPVAVPMILDIDALTSPTLKHLRQDWWNTAFAEFLEETLRPKPGRRILDVGCGTGTADASLSRLRLSQLRLVGVDLILERVKKALDAARGMNARVGYACADASRLPFPDRAFDSTFCVAVLQHIRDIDHALREFVRVTRAGGRILAVEPDNASRYWFSSHPSGMRAFQQARQFFNAVAAARDEAAPSALGPMLPALFNSSGIETLSVQVFPVSVTHLGSPPAAVWKTRLELAQKMAEEAGDSSVGRMGKEYLAAIQQYEHDASTAGPTFVEIQNTMLFATLGQRPE